LCYVCFFVCCACLRSPPHASLLLTPQRDPRTGPRAAALEDCERRRRRAAAVAHHVDVAAWCVFLHLFGKIIFSTLVRRRTHSATVCLVVNVTLIPYGASHLRITELPQLLK